MVNGDRFVVNGLSDSLSMSMAIGLWSMAIQFVDVGLSGLSVKHKRVRKKTADSVTFYLRPKTMIICF